MIKFKESIEDFTDNLTWYYKRFLKHPFYDVVWYFKNMFHYHKVVAKMRPWDYMYVFDMLSFTLNDLKECLKTGHEIDEYRLPKVKRIERVLELIKNVKADDYMERCGYKYDNFDFKTEKIEGTNSYELKKVQRKGKKEQNFKEYRLKAIELENKEMEELFSIIKNDIKGWWD
jgi:hypothetical protein